MDHRGTMDELRSILEEALNEKLNQIVLSNSRDSARAVKVKIRPVQIGGELKFQETRYQGTKVFHENFGREETALRTENYLRELFRQGQMDWDGGTAAVLVSKKGKMTVKARRGGTGINASTAGVKASAVNASAGGPAEDPALRLAHNRVKRYLLPEGEPVDFLVELGVQTPEGKVRKERYDKFRQINRYLEFIEDVLEELPKDRTLHIVDFGCGKSYLTFAMYYYLHVKQGRDLQVTGLDLKEDVIRHCNETAEKLGYEGLHFEMGDIGAYRGKTGRTWWSPSTPAIRPRTMPWKKR